MIRNRHHIRGFAGTLLLLCVAGAAAGQESATELIEATHIFGPSPRMEVDATMSISERGTTQTRRLEAWYEREDRSFSLFVHIVQPPFLRNMKFLLQRTGSREESWMRTSRGVRRLGESGGRERVFGSHFTVRDFARIDPSSHRIEYVGKPTDDRAVIEVVPEDSAMGRRRFTVEPETRLIREIEFLDSSGAIEKRYELLEVKRVDGQPVPARARMREPGGGDETVITLDSVEFPSRIPSRYFSRGNL